MAEQTMGRLLKKTSDLPYSARPNETPFSPSLGIFSKLPTEIRLLIWRFYLAASQISPTSRCFSLMTTSTTICQEVKHVLSRVLELRFNNIATSPDFPPGIIVSDETNTQLGFIRCAGPKRNLAVMKGSRLSDRLPYHLARKVIFNVRPVSADDLSDFLTTWFESLQMAQFILCHVPPRIHIEIRFHSWRKRWNLRKLTRALDVDPSDFPSEICDDSRKMNVELLVIAFLAVIRSRLENTKVSLSMRGNPVDLGLDENRLLYHAFEHDQKENIMTFWLYSQCLSLPGYAADSWRLRLFAEWDRVFEAELAHQMFRNMVDQIEFSDPTFQDLMQDGILNLYRTMRAYNPMSYWKRINPNCTASCCQQSMMAPRVDNWDRHAWYVLYPQGIECLHSASHQDIMLRYSDPRLNVLLTPTGIDVDAQTHELDTSPMYSIYRSMSSNIPR